MGIMISREAVPFAEGGSRLAYKGIITFPPSMFGKECVIKINKNWYAWTPADWSGTRVVYEEARRLAALFNRRNALFLFNGRNNFVSSIYFVNTCVCQDVVHGFLPFGPQFLGYVLVEESLPGVFMKWCNNNGDIAPCSDLLQAFMHWSWVESGGQKMIADLQGTMCYPDYVLTDPAFMSNSVAGGMYGCTDTGIEGIALFFLRHRCSEYCSMLPKPTISDILATPDPRFLSDVLSQKTRIPLYLKENMTKIFPFIATRH